MADAPIVQQISGNGGGYQQSYSIVMPSNTTAGNCLVLFISEHSETEYTLTVSDSQAGTWTKVGNGGDFGVLFYRANISGGPLTLTLDWGTGYHDFAFMVREYSGLSSSPLDTFVEVNEVDWLNAHPLGPTSSPSQASTVVVAAYSGDSNSTYTAEEEDGYSNLVSLNHSDLYGSMVYTDKEISSISQQTMTFSSTVYVKGYGIIAVFKKGESGGDPDPPAYNNKAAFLAFFD
ncbi:MAG: hypothetical protein M0P69_19225 [Bacteroidales bacterium]|nr:hypothetical protein [Bacteroidales bacterium]